ncbi:hypothetical protein [Sphingobium yanoikuyae]|uniref:hypothetical protein n=1 Tax=Sphingobium yanoikuyae TaxID=13690 RepID=UPI0012D335B6|nr:hypothetical protein [Sphingobium yanoikuyae]
MSIKSFIAQQERPCRFILRDRRGDIIDCATATIDLPGKLTVISERDGSSYTSFSAWRGSRTPYANTYDMIATEDGLLLRTIVNEGVTHSESEEADPTPAETAANSLADRFRYRLYHGHAPVEYLDYMKRTLQHDLQRYDDLVGNWTKVAKRALSEAVKAQIRFQYGLRWADKNMECLYREHGCAGAVDRGEETAMDHVIPVSELAAAVLDEGRSFDHRFSTLVRAWLCPVAHITKESHARLTNGSHPDHGRPFHRYALAQVVANDHDGQDVETLTLDEHFHNLRKIEWVAPIIERHIDPYGWEGLKIAN